MSQPVAQIQILMMDNGKVVARAEVPSRTMLNAMMVTAHQNLLEKLKDREDAEKKGEAIEVAPPGFLGK